MLAKLLVSSFALASMGAIMVARLAGKLSLIDCPEERSSHCQPTPKGGGVGILAAFSLVGMVSGVSLWFWGPISVLSLMAGYGDRVELNVRLRLAAQLGLISLFVLGTWHSSPNDCLSFPLILFWIVFITGSANFYNFMDGINGIAGISGAVGFSLLAFYLYGREGPATLGNLSMCMAFSCLGFLPLNVPKARVFMGDIGSILLGAVFAGVVYLGSNTLLDFLCMASFLFPFYADELTTMAVRFKKGENITQAHRKHLYQLFANEKGIPHWQVSIIFGCLQLFVGISVLVTKFLGSYVVLAILIFYFVAFSLVSWYFRSYIELQVNHRHLSNL